MKYLLFICLSIQAYACKEELTQKPECDKCFKELSKCMSKALDESKVLTQTETEELRKECRKTSQMCTEKNQCANKE